MSAKQTKGGEAKLDRRNTKNPYPIRSNYKKPKTKAQKDAEYAKRKLAKFKGLIPPCGEDTVNVSVWARYKNPDDARRRFDNSKKYPKEYGDSILKLRGRNYYYEKDALPGIKTWIPYKYRGDGIELGFTNNIKEERSDQGTRNAVFRLGPVALEYGFMQPYNLALYSISEIAVFVKILISEVHVHIDVPRHPVSFFEDRYKAGLWGGKIGKKISRFSNDENKGVTFSIQSTNLDIKFYDKVAELSRDSDDVRHKREVYLRKFGPLPDVLTRIEFVIRRPLLRDFDFGNKFLDDGDDWQRCKGGVMHHIMTKMFYFKEKNGAIMPEWTWLCDQLVAWADRENQALALGQTTITRQKRPVTPNADNAIKRAISTLQNIGHQELGRPVTTSEDLIQYFRLIASDPDRGEKIFGDRFRNNGNKAYHKHKARYDNQAILDHSLQPAGITTGQPGKDVSPLPYEIPSWKHVARPSPLVIPPKPYATPRVIDSPPSFLTPYDEPSLPHDDPCDNRPLP